MTNTMITTRASWFRRLRSQSRYLIGALIFGALAEQQLSAATPGQAYHRQPVCADGNCVPNRTVGGYNATRWRPWPGGEPSLSAPTPPVGIELKNTDPPSRDRELELPTRPTAPADNIPSEPSPNDRPGGGTSLPRELENVTPRRPVEVPLPGSSSLPSGPQFPGSNPMSGPKPLLIGAKPMQPRSFAPNEPAKLVPADEPPPMLKVRPEVKAQSGLMPEMVPWSEEEKNPVVRQIARITGNQVQQTINLNEGTLPDASAAQPVTIQIRQENSPSRPIQTIAIAAAPIETKPLRNPVFEQSVPEPEFRSAANAPAILPNVEARPLPVPQQPETVSQGPAVLSPLRGVSQGNPLRR